MKAPQFKTSDEALGPAPKPSEPVEKYTAPALSRGLDILELLASTPNGVTQIEIARRLARAPSEIFRVLRVLCERGYVAVNIGNHSYALTSKMFEVAHRHPPIRRLTDVAASPMQALADRLGQSIHLSILRSGFAQVIWHAQCVDEELVFLVRLGAQETFHESSAGLVHAAWMEERELAGLLASNDGIDQSLMATFMSTLSRVRRDGFAETESTALVGVTNVSVPVFNQSKGVIASLTIPFVHPFGRVKASLVEARAELIALGEWMSQRLR